MLRFGTVGTGWITESYIEGALDSGLWTLGAVCSRSREKGAALAEKYGGAEVFTDPEEMAKSDCIDAVYIASPNSLHMALSRLFLENGKHVLCEKPLSAHAEDVRAVQALAAERGLIFLEAIMYLHLPERQLLERALREIGDISVAKIDFCQRSSKYDAFLAGELPNIFNPALETGALMDLGVYCIYPALALFGLPEDEQITAQFLSSGADSGGGLLMRYPDKLVHIVYSKIGQAAANTDFQGVRGTVSVGSISRLADIEIIQNDGSRETLCGGEPKYKLMGYESKDFYRYITQPEENAAEYEACARLAREVSAYMEHLRKKAGIRFPSDPADF